MSQNTYASGASDRAATADTAAAADLRYTRTAIALHWAIALLVLSTIPLGLYGAAAHDAAARTAKDVHKAIGIAILALTLVRVGWRLGHRPPPLPASYAPALRRIARATHVGFYALLLILPFSGWWMSSAVPQRHVISFGVIDVPFLPVPRGWASAGIAHAVHVGLAWVMIALAALHIAAAMKHRFVDRDGILARMLPRARVR